LISAIGMKKAPSGTTRGVFVVNKSGKVLAAEPGGPAATVEVIRKLVADQGSASEDKTINEDIGNVEEDVRVMDENDAANGATSMGPEIASAPVATAPLASANGNEEKKEDVAAANIAADVADSAQKLDAGVAV
jgi:peroxiredoxin Q/BCP